MDADEQTALDNIAKHGCHILHILEEGDYPRFTYSIGIQRQTGQPELIVTGLKRELAIWVVNEYSRRVAEGEVFRPDELYDGFIGNFQVTFKEVEKQHYREYFGWARWLYRGDDFRVLQLIYPSTSGVWPWDANATEDYKWFLPKLYAR